MAQITRRLNNNSEISQRNFGVHYNIAHTTIERNLMQRTSIRPRKRIKAPKYVKDQEKRAQKNCGVLYRQIPKDCFIVMDDEKYFGLSGADIPGNAFFYTNDASTTPPNVKYKQYQKFEPKLLV
ncbi:unnamed protein product [Didymodactylos carnosus]|nr:unnamed protein product [Didymodactylos carnosus]CAF4529473.1 unnamed protein product [Didymodactylos carnosus]